jgi:osmoprotectant transport system substrate-binding protein
MVTYQMGTSTLSAAGRRGVAAGAAAVSLALALTACGGGGDSLENQKGDSGGGKKGSVVIGGGDFTEGSILTELYAQVLHKAGYSTSTQTAKREIYEPLLEKGQIGVVPEYAATFAEYLNLKENGPKAKPVASGDADATMAALRKLAGPRGLTVLDPGQAVDQNAFAVTKDFADKHHLKTLTDLGKSKAKVKLAAGDECPARPFCEPGLKKTYGIDVSSLDPKGVGTVAAKQAVKNGTDQLVLTTTTDATLGQFNLVLLQDDKKLQNADNVVPVVNTKKAGAAGITAALDKLTKVLTTQDLTDLNQQVDGERKKPADVVKEYLTSKGLI